MSRHLEEDLKDMENNFFRCVDNKMIDINSPDIFSGIFGDHSSRAIKEIEPLVKKVASFEPELSLLDR
jgi:hypothetical protein